MTNTIINTAIDNSKKNTSLSSFVVEGLSPLSPKAFAEFDKLRNAYENYETIDNSWEYPPCFLVALREHFLASGKEYDAKNIESVILSMDWLFDGVSYQTFYRHNEEHQKVTIKQYNGNNELSDEVYSTSNLHNLEVLRDMCLPMVYNW